MGYNGVLNEVFTCYAVKPCDGGTYADEITMKDEMLLLENTTINDTFMNTTPQEMISFFLAKAGVSKARLSGRHYPVRRLVSIQKQTARQAIDTVNAAWNIRVPFFFSGGVFYWDEKPEQSNVYTFEYGVNIIRLSRAGGVWEPETVSAPFVKHSHKIIAIGKPLMLSLDFPPLKTGHETFTSSGLPSRLDCVKFQTTLNICKTPELVEFS